MLELDDFIRRNCARAFDWGEWDCVIFVFAWRERLKGDHPYKHLIGTYSTELGAARVIRRDLGGSIHAALSAHMREIPHADRRMGDVALDDSGKPKTAIVGRLAAYWLGEGGIMKAPIPDHAKIYRVV